MKHRCLFVGGPKHGEYLAVDNLYDTVAMPVISDEIVMWQDVKLLEEGEIYPYDVGIVEKILYEPMMLGLFGKKSRMPVFVPVGMPEEERNDRFAELLLSAEGKVLRG